MYGLFEYYDIKSRNNFKIVIGQYISSKLRKEELLTPEIINQLNRMKLAEEFIIERTNNGEYRIDEYYRIECEYEVYELENDVAEYIDLKLPQQYWYISLKSSGEARQDYPGIIGIEGVEYFYSKNYEREKILLQEYKKIKEKQKEIQRNREIHKSIIRLTITCETCKAPLVIRDGRYGKFLGCSKFPDCSYRISLKKAGLELSNRLE